MDAFTLLARPDDRLAHVLVNDEVIWQHRERPFYWPRGERAGERVDLIEVFPPRLYYVLRDQLQSDEAGARSRKALLRRIEAYQYLGTPPARLVLEANEQGQTCLHFYAADGRLLDYRAELSPSETTTLLVLIEAALRTYERQDEQRAYRRDLRSAQTDERRISTPRHRP
jgi:hypothetical protein